jgi:putative ABC transport system permease protein
VLKVALRGLRAHKVRFLATLLAVVLGVGFMIGTRVLGDTVTSSFDQVFTDVYASIDVVVRSDDNSANPFDGRSRVGDDTLVAAAAVPGVTAAEGQVQGITQLIDASGEAVTAADGPPTFALNWLTSPELSQWRLVEGSAPVGPGDVVLDRRTATDAGFVVGDPVTLELVGRPEPFTVTGIAIFGELGSYAGSGAVLLETSVAQAALTEPGTFNWVSVAAEPGISQEQLAAAIEPVAPDGTEVLTGAAFTEETIEPVQRFIEDFVRFISIFGLIALFVGSFIIYNTFNVIVAQRLRELALLRAIGARRSQVLGSVVGEATITGAVAAVGGIGFGILLAAGLRSLLDAIGFSLPPAPLLIDAGAFVTPVLLAVGVTIVSALIPAWRASRVAPLAALREVSVDRSGRSWLRVAVGAVMLAVAAWLLQAGLALSGEPALQRIGASLVLVILAATALGPLYVRPLARGLQAVLGRLAGITGRLAGHNARRNPARTGTTAMALTIGVTLVTVIAIVAASLVATENQVVERTIVGDFVVQPDNFGSGLAPEVADEIAAVEGVAVATGWRAGVVDVDDGPRILAGVDTAAIQQLIDLDVIDGSLDDLRADGVAISDGTAERSDLALGDTLPVTFPVDGLQPLTVRAIYTNDALVGRGGSLLVTTERFDLGFPPNAQLDAQVVVAVDDSVNPVSVRPALIEIIDRYPTVTLQDLGELQQSNQDQVEQFVAFLYALLGLSVVIGLIGIVNTLLLSVVERTRELGLLRAVGSIRGQVASMVLQESVIIAVVGTLVGTVVGIGYGAAIVRGLSEAEDVTVLAVPTGQLAVTVLIAAVAGVVAGVWPAWRASRLDVLDAIAVE